MTRREVPEAALRRRLLDRVEASHRHERQFTTVRREPREWSARSSTALSSVIALAPGARLVLDPACNHVELVVLAGGVLVDDRQLACGDALVAGALRCAEAHPTEGARVYLRQSRVDAPIVRGLMVHTQDDAGWDDFCPGVRIRELWNGGERRSVLVRMRPGASVVAHAHPLEEECMMLDGEAFIGDTLLRSGEFQLAPPGSRHGGITTDVGALFFVHGSLDPSAYA